MNKKFSTLMVGALLTSAFTVNAQSHALTTDMGEIPYRTLTTQADAFDKGVTDGASVTTYYNDYRVRKIEQNSKWYQLEVGAVEDKAASGHTTDSVLVQLRDYNTGRLYLKVVPQDSLITESTVTPAGQTNPSLNASLWQIEVTSVEDGSFMYRYKNKETGYYLSFNCADATDLSSLSALDANGTVYGGAAATDTIKSDLDSWRWYTTAEKTEGTFGPAKPYVFNHDRKSIVGLAQNSKQEVVLVKIAREKLNATDDESMVSNLNILKLTVRNAGARVLTAADINTMIDADGSWMNRTGVRTTARFKDSLNKLVNDLTSGTYTAKNSPVADLQNAADNIYAGYSILMNNANKYLMVAEDSTYENNKVSSNYGGFKVFDADPTATLTTATAINALNARYHWKVTYYPTPDSLVFEPLNASMVADGDKQLGRKWADTPLADASIEMFYNTVNAAVAHDSTAVGGQQILASTKTNAAAKKSALQPVALTMMDVAGDKVLTVGQSNRDVKAYQSPEKFGKPVITDVPAEMDLKITFDHQYSYLTRTSVPTDLYYMRLFTTNNQSTVRNNAAYLVDNMDGNLMYDHQAMDQDFSLMPATQWVVERDSCEEGRKGVYQTPTVRIHNREYGAVNGAVFSGQLYNTGKLTEAGDTVYMIIDHSGDYSAGLNSYGMFDKESLRCADSVYFQKVTRTDAVKSANHGYKKFTTDELLNGIENNYNLKYYHFENDKLYLQSQKDKLTATKEITDEADATIYEIAEAAWTTMDAGAITNDFGYRGKVADIANLQRKAYVIKIKDKNLIDNNQLFIALVKNTTDNKYYYEAKTKTDILNSAAAGDGLIKKAIFYLKADQVRSEEGANGKVVTDSCYVLVDLIRNPGNAQGDTLLANGWNKANVVDGLGYLRYSSLNDNPEDRASAFYLKSNVRPQYINMEEEYNISMNDTVKISRKSGTSNEYLFEDRKDSKKVGENQPISKTLGYLGVEGKGVVLGTSATGSPALYVDKVWASSRAHNGYMPQYLFAVDVDSIADGWICNTKKHGYWETKKAAEEFDDATHINEYNGYVAGRFLINLSDSVEANFDMLDKADKFKFENYTRLAFVEGVHQVDTTGVEYLYILKPGKSLADVTTIKNNTLGGNIIDLDSLKANSVSKVLTGAHNNYAFSLRKLNNYNNEPSTASEGFLLESNGAGSGVGAFAGAWVKIHNGIPVLAQVTKNEDHEGNAGSIQEIIDQAQIFNFGQTKDVPTDNEVVNVASFGIASGNGSVTITNAATKAVTISNILGQTLANTVLTSDNASISVPAGIVVVAVEGEDAVKVIVK